MSTVRMSERLIDDIKTQARKKFDNTNPTKDLPTDLGESVADRYELTNKSLATFKFLNDTWAGLHQEELFTYNQIIVNGTESYTDRWGEEQTRDCDFTLDLNTPREAPGFIVSGRNYSDNGYLKVTLPYNDPVLVECISTQKYNRELSDKRYEFINNLEDTMRKFTTLNQALKATDGAIKDLIPQDKIETVYKKDDRTQRAAELAEIASTELTDLKEIILTDSLLGDD